MKGYILSIAGVVLLSAVVAVIAPNGKMGKFVKGTVKLIGLVILITPFVSLFRGEGFVFQSENIALDSAYIQNSVNLMSDADEREIASYLKSEYGVTAEVECERNSDSRFSVKTLRIKIVDFGIIGDGEHIDNLSSIRSDLEKRYCCEAEVT
ncbi:MAG: stage III sporulation protein AF [Clostridiales bacterium]|nr:stage III sporulation protein AF [Clostridiales bacterium]